MTHKYTKRELLEADIADMEVEIQCAERDGLSGYAERCRAGLVRLQSELATMNE